MITGHDRDGRPGAVIVELKQWSDDVLPSSVEDMVTVRYGYGKKETLHPSAQVGPYRHYLADAHETFHDGNVRLRACASLHEFVHDDQSELLAPRHVNVLGTHPCSPAIVSPSSCSSSMTISCPVRKVHRKIDVGGLDSPEQACRAS
jgi:uncharacterized protein